MKEIAQLAGVSIGTVDRVLHHRGRVSAENMAKIQAIVADRGYRPNVFASRLSRGTLVKTVGVVIPRPDQDFGYWRLIRAGMDRAVRELEPLHFAVVFDEYDRHDPEAAAGCLRRVLEGGAGGVALAPIHSRALRPLIEELDPKLPVVFFDSDMECQRPRCFVGQDPWQGGRLAGRLLSLSLEPGRPVVMVKFDEDDEHLQKRCEGFLDYARATGRQVLVLDQKLGDPAPLRQAVTEAFLDAHPVVGGLFVPNASVGEYASAGLGRRVVGYDLIPGNVEALRDGRVDFILSQRPEVMGYEAVRGLGRALLFRDPLPEKIGLPLDVILKENLEGYWAAPGRQ